MQACKYSKTNDVNAHKISSTQVHHYRESVGIWKLLNIKSVFSDLRYKSKRVSSYRLGFSQYFIGNRIMIIDSYCNNRFVIIRSRKTF